MLQKLEVNKITKKICKSKNSNATVISKIHRRIDALKKKYLHAPHLLH